MLIIKPDSSSIGFLSPRGGSVCDLCTLGFVPTDVLLASLARIIVYSMSSDGVPTPGSTAPTPIGTPLTSGASTPLPHHGANGAINGLADYLSAPLLKAGHGKVKTYLAGSKALDSLAKFIASTEGFFHPTNSGNWTNDVCVTSLRLLL